MNKKDDIKKLDELFTTLISKYELIDRNCINIERKIKSYRKKNRVRMMNAKRRWRIIRKRLQDEDETYFNEIERKRLNFFISGDTRV